ncbi:hypothetical protein P7C73_g3839, partial [Tremellales sp. Uapishka_1]
MLAHLVFLLFAIYTVAASDISALEKRLQAREDDEQADTPAPGSSSGETVGAGTIVAIVLGSVAGLLVLLLAAWALSRSWRGPPGVAEGSTEEGMKEQGGGESISKLKHDWESESIASTVGQ